MSCGLPCIGTDVEGIREDIRHEETGYLCDTDPEHIATAIHNIISDEVLQKKIGRNARQYIIDNYSIDVVVKQELSVIEDVISL
jgi:glycosyltransferase involved in cell wall biosynthesis